MLSFQKCNQKKFQKIVRAGVAETKGTFLVAAPAWRFRATTQNCHSSEQLAGTKFARFGVATSTCLAELSWICVRNRRIKCEYCVPVVTPSISMCGGRDKIAGDDFSLQVRPLFTCCITLTVCFDSSFAGLACLNIHLAYTCPKTCPIISK
jgi:hypothetical protein